MPLPDLLATFADAPWYRGQVVHVETLPARQPDHASIDLPPGLERYLEERGISLYRHQVETMCALRAGHDVVISTPTSSGKTLAFNLPIVEQLDRDPEACALYIYPLKALANDQMEKLLDLEHSCETPFRPSTYDGDTPARRRTQIKQTSRVILTNAHALHQYLPWHHQWARIFANLKAIVLDEAHQYRGVFGANVSFLLRRLQRILRHYNAQPRIVVSSASMANPAEFSRSLTGREAVLIDADTSARGETSLAFWDSTLDPQTSVTAQAARLMASLSARGVQTLCFARTRATAERVAKVAQSMGAEAVSAYRAGYLPAERRQLEAALRNGALRGVVSTSALESGIDIGGLDAAILVGFPGSLLAAWQQAGRAGRGTAPSLVVFMPCENPLDRFFLHHPDQFLSARRERLVIPARNVRLQTGHLVCAAAELPLREDEISSEERPLVDALCTEGLLAPSPRGFLYRGLRRAHEAFPLDDLAGQSVRLISQGTLLETMDPIRARRDAYPGAVLLHRGDTYVIERLDLEQGVAEARREEVGYHTRGLKASEIELLSTEEHRQLAGAEIAWGRVRVTEKFAGYQTVHRNRVLSTTPLHLPPNTYDSDALWIVIREAISGLAEIELPGALHGAEHALMAMAPLLALCDGGDIGGMSTSLHAQTLAPTILLHDAITDGAGLAEVFFAEFSRLVADALSLVDDCPCQEGCPSCVLSPRCGSQNQPLSKEGTVRVLQFLSKQGGSP